MFQSVSVLSSQLFCHAHTLCVCCLFCNRQLFLGICRKVFCVGFCVCVCVVVMGYVESVCEGGVQCVEAHVSEPAVCEG